MQAIQSKCWHAGRAEAAESRESGLQEEVRQAASLVQTLENDLLLAQRSRSSAPATQPEKPPDEGFSLANGHSPGALPWQLLGAAYAGPAHE